MESIPTIAIIGRPNVGKSSLMNRIVGYRHAIVDPTPGVTRDRNYAESTWNGRRFNLVDTGGLDPDDSQALMTSIRQQVDFALREAEAIIFVCDGRAGLAPDDKQILNFLRKNWSAHPMFVAINKLDNANDESQLAEFYELGIAPLYPVSAVHGHGVADLLDVIVKQMPVNDTGEEEKRGIELERIAIVGKPNVGKSMLFNRLIGQNRSIVDNVAGTTRDTILFKFQRGEKTYNFIDTAGLRRPDREKDDVEQYSVYRTLGAIKNTDLAILVMDASEGCITYQDKRIAGRIIDSGAGCIIIWNKWDIASHDEHFWAKLTKETRDAFPLLEFAPMIATSGKTGLRVNKLFDLIDHIQETGHRRISNEILKSILYDAVTIQPPPAFKGRELKLNSLIQLEGPPIVFKLKCSEPKGVHFSYQRYLLNHLRQEETFEGWPMKLITGH
ncbi:MAG TPA: ribosome biogenesis GTPase Der [Candidatus Rifleibacterium sp.]|nr:ribosome biogenesis GTPase Der [Candidatus Rifleibacterium sp.]HPT44927.1 ribosome biogenesis GTPase Der [Candidatus Rifleibacterium sp.]